MLYTLSVSMAFKYPHSRNILSHYQSTFQRGVELQSKFTLFGEGARGSLSEEVIKKLVLLLK